MHHRWFVHVACALLLAGILPAPAFGSSFHSFAANNEGWQIVDYPFRSHVAAPASAALPFNGGFGNPAGSVRAGDVEPETGIMAPADHLGNQGSIYGDTLRYDILIRYTDGVTYPAVVLNGGTMSLYYDTPSPVVGVWEPRVVPLTETGWKVAGSHAVATQTDFMNVLSNLTGVYIYTEWHTGTDDTNVDNIDLPIGRPTGVVGGTPGARGVLMRPTFPNPSGGTTDIAFSVGQPGPVTVAVFDVSGRSVRTLAGELFVAGTATVTWDGLTDEGKRAPSGIYFARVTTAAGGVASRKIVRVR